MKNLPSIAQQETQKKELSLFLHLPQTLVCVNSFGDVDKMVRSLGFVFYTDPAKVDSNAKEYIEKVKENIKKNIEYIDLGFILSAISLEKNLTKRKSLDDAIEFLDGLRGENIQPNQPVAIGKYVSSLDALRQAFTELHANNPMQDIDDELKKRLANFLPELDSEDLGIIYDYLKEIKAFQVDHHTKDQVINKLIEIKQWLLPLEQQKKKDLSSDPIKYKKGQREKELPTDYKLYIDNLARLPESKKIWNKLSAQDRDKAKEVLKDLLLELMGNRLPNNYLVVRFAEVSHLFTEDNIDMLLINTIQNINKNINKYKQPYYITKIGLVNLKSRIFSLQYVVSGKNYDIHKVSTTPFLRLVYKTTSRAVEDFFAKEFFTKAYNPYEKTYKDIDNKEEYVDERYEDHYPSQGVIWFMRSLFWYPPRAIVFILENIMQPLLESVGKFLQSKGYNKTKAAVDKVFSLTQLISKVIKIPTYAMHNFLAFVEEFSNADRYTHDPANTVYELLKNTAKYVYYERTKEYQDILKKEKHPQNIINNKLNSRKKGKNSNWIPKEDIRKQRRKEAEAAKANNS